jgi:hypothetical protein
MSHTPDTLPPPARLTCDETGMPADYSYVMPDGKTHYVCQSHAQAVIFRLQSLGLRGIEGFEPPQVELRPIERPAPATAAIDWRALAQEYRGQAEAAAGQTDELQAQIRSLNGQLGVKQGEIDQLRTDLHTLNHSQVATQLAAANEVIALGVSEVSELKTLLGAKENEIDQLRTELATANGLLQRR